MAMTRSLQERLRTLQASVGVSPERCASPTVSAVDVLREQGFQSDPQTGVLHREVRTDILTRHGAMRFADLLDADLTAVARAAKVTPFEASNLRFYDTETTGLGTGAGTIPFLHAVGQFEEDDFVVHQYFLEDYSQELALIQLLLERHFATAQVATLVSFNGKSFDWPLLKSRLTMHRLEAPAVHHVDLLYPSRRLWRHSLGCVSLGNVEQAVLGLVRSDDLPGKEAPQRYFEFASDGDAARLIPIFVHNATDVCSLVTLTTHLARVLGGSEEPTIASEWVALARIYDEWRESDLAARYFAGATDCPDASWRAHWLRSLHCKRRGDWADAKALWLEMVDRYTWSASPCVELAKVYEHRLRDYSQALRFARAAQQRARSLSALRQGPGGQRLLVALDHRIQRIQRKVDFHC